MAYEASLSLKIRVEHNYTQADLDKLLDSYAGQPYTEAVRSEIVAWIVERTAIKVEVVPE